MSLHLVEEQTGKQIGEYLTEQSALRAVWTTIEHRGAAAAAGMRLEYEDEKGQGKILAQGEGLVRRASLVNRHRGRPN